MVQQAARTSKRKRTPAWSHLSEQELLALPLKDLDLSLHGTWVEGCWRELIGEMKAQGIDVRPHIWLGEEWFSPDNTTGIAVPFYLAHPRLVRLERKMLYEVEGGTRGECMQIFRHEAGHVIQHAYGLHRRKRWQELFGRSSQRYPSYYRPNPASKDYVQHLRRWYAQSHPDEDFAETFAVWLTPRSGWRKRYADWPALEKLEYVDELMSEVAGKKPILTNRIEVEPIGRASITLGEHYNKKRAHYAVDTRKSYDHDLERIFARGARFTRSPAAASFVRHNRAAIRDMVTRKNGADDVVIDAVLDEMMDRCRILKLRAPVGAQATQLKATVTLAAKTVHSLYHPTHREWFAL